MFCHPLTVRALLFGDHQLHVATPTEGQLTPSYANKSWPIRNNSKAMDVALMASADDRFENDLDLDDQPTGATVCSCDHSRTCAGKFFAVHPMAER